MAPCDWQILASNEESGAVLSFDFNGLCDNGRLAGRIADTALLHSNHVMVQLKNVCFVFYSEMVQY